MDAGEAAPLLATDSLSTPHGPRAEQHSFNREGLERRGSENIVTVTDARQGYGTVVSPVSHCHQSGAVSSIDKKARRKLIIASVLCLIFMILEIIGGAMAGSLAIMTDAAHLLTDFASFMISLLAIFLASLPPTKKMSFGWHRAEIVGALVSVLMIWVITGILVYMAIMRVIHKDYDIDAVIMLITSSVGVLVNIIMATTLHQHAHSHASGTESGRKYQAQQERLLTTNDYPAVTSEDEALMSAVPSSIGNINSALEEQGTSSGHHNTARSSGRHHGHSHGHGEDDGEENINVRAAFIHTVGDFVQSLGVLIASLIIYFKPNESYNIADPICTFVFSILVLLTTVNILRETMHVLMEGAPKGLNFDEVKQQLAHVPGVVEVHNLRMWSLTTSKSALSVHLAFDRSHNPQVIQERASRELRQAFRMHDVTIQMEPYVPAMASCDNCQDPAD